MEYLEQAGGPLAAITANDGTDLIQNKEITGTDWECAFVFKFPTGPSPSCPWTQ